MKSIAKITFDGIQNFPHSKSCIFKGNKWLTPTLGVEPNSWTVCIIYLEDLQIDNTVMAEIKMFPEADYLHVVGNKFELFGAKQFKCYCQILEVIQE